MTNTCISTSRKKWKNLFQSRIILGIRKKLKKVHEGNIMLLVLFIMFVSSLLGLIVVQYVQHLISVSSLFQQYYRSYYYAYGGLELGLAQAKYHGYGFQDGVDNDFVFSDFASCSGYNVACNTDLIIKSRWNPIADSYEDFTSCDALDLDTTGDQIDYSLTAGDAIIIPLFRDTSTGFNTVTYDVLSSSGFQNMNPEIFVEGGIGENYLLKVVDENLENYNSTEEPTVTGTGYEFAPALGDFASAPDNKNYLVVANASGSVKDFCIELDPGSALVSKYIFIESVGTFGDSVASLSALKVDQLPSFLGYGTINSW